MEGEGKNGEGMSGRRDRKGKRYRVIRGKRETKIKKTKYKQNW